MDVETIEAAAGPEAFRSRVRRFLHDNLPARLAATPRVGLVLPPAMQLEWQRILHNHGLGAPGWPREHGGRGWSLGRMHMWYDECAKARAPRHTLQSLSMLGPILMQFGSARQRARHLPAIISGEVMWCQGYSEPGSGSDLVSLKTRAVRDGDDFVVNGQKIWTSSAHESDWMFALVRTDDAAPAPRGISFLLIDMRTIGIAIRPIISIDGLHHLNEVFFTDVRVPAENLVGAANEGWRYAKALLNHERLSICDPTELRARAALLQQFSGSPEGRAWLGDSKAAIDRKLAGLDIELDGLDATYQRVLAALEGGRDPGQSASALKFIDTQLSQTLTEIGVEIAGLTACAEQTPMFEALGNFEPVGPASLALAFAGYALSRAHTILGGASEIQKNIIWRAISR
jgi:alkylation response protein AidB-like acyl-CoA dehydrogenase